MSRYIFNNYNKHSPLAQAPASWSYEEFAPRIPKVKFIEIK